MVCRNVGGVDRALRLFAGAVLLTTGVVLLVSGNARGAIVTVVGALVLASGVLGFCPPYVLLGVSTAKPKRPAAPGATAGGAQPR